MHHDPADSVTLSGVWRPPISYPVNRTDSVAVHLPLSSICEVMVQQEGEVNLRVSGCVDRDAVVLDIAHIRG